jgi:hypothetical protein
MTKNTEKNTSAENKKAYDKKHFKYQTVCFKVDELEEINEYCKQNGIPKNTFFRDACKLYMETYYN